MRWAMRGACGLLAGLVAWLVLWGASPLLGKALNGAFDGCTDRRDCLGDSLLTALLAVSVGIAVMWTATFLVGWLTLRALRVDRPLLVAVVGMVLTTASWWAFGEVVLLAYPVSFGVAALAVGTLRTT